MNKKSLKKLGFYLLILQLSACQTPAPKLKADENLDNRLENPTYAQQIPAKIANVTTRDKTIYNYLANADLAWQREDYDEVTRLYEALDQFDPGNLRAREGLKQLEMVKRHDDIIAIAEGLMNQNEASGELALAKLRFVLSENPLHKKALPLYNQLLAKQAELSKAKLSKKLIFNQPVTMEFRDVNLKMIFESLSKTTKINFILYATI